MKKYQMIAAMTLLLAGSMTVNCYAEAAEDAALEEEKRDADSMIASKDEMIEQDEVVEEGMVPIPGSDIKDGEYSIEVASSSSMFKIVDCVLTVKDGKMTAVMTLSGTGYLKLFMGTGKEAVEASEDTYIPFVENEEGKYTYEVPVEALDQGIDCTAFSKNKEKWYDRILVFKSSSLPQEAFLNLDVATVESLGLEDGEYQVDVLLEGGSGKTAVESPTKLTVLDGKATATVVWGSPKYDYMKVDGEQYLPVNTEGNAAFEIPVESFDWKLPIIVDSVALGKPVEKDYTLTFDSASITEAGQVSAETEPGETEEEEAKPEPENGKAESEETASEGAKAEAAEKTTTLDSLNLEDGEYQVEVTLEGGSGKASVESPAALKVQDGSATATLIWSSPNYDYMVVGEEKYMPVNTEGNSTFEIPVEGFDWEMQVTADTVAMSTPHEITYTLNFDSATIMKAEK